MPEIVYLRADDEKLPMKQYLLVLCFLMLAVLLCSCSSSRVLRVDLREYEGLEDGSHYMMVVHQPLKENLTDTVYWSGDKTGKMEIHYDDCLAFVDVFQQGEEDGYEIRLFRCVAAIEGDKVTICARNRNDVSLSGTQSNELISGFLHQEFQEEKQMREWITDGIEKHPNDLYGAYLYSLDVLFGLMEWATEQDLYGEETPAIHAGRLRDEINQSSSYLSRHCVALPALEDVMMIGAVTPLVVKSVIGYLIPTGY